MNMIQEHIDQIQEKVQKDAAISETTKADLLQLLSTLKAEIHVLSQTQADAASSVARFAAASAHEATRKEQQPKLLEVALKGLHTSVEGLEASHPQLAAVVNRIAVTLSNMGI